MVWSATSSIKVSGTLVTGMPRAVAASTSTESAPTLPNEITLQFSKLSIIFSYLSLKKFKNKLDPRKYNGAIFLGLKGPVVKSHGATDALGFSYSVELCYKIAKGKLSDKIKKNCEEVHYLCEFRGD